jgi:bud emergence protein 1
MHGGKDTLQGQGPQISTPIPSVSRPTNAIQPPKKVIRALEDYPIKQAVNELTFQKGDFFHVINEIDQGPGWYEANNPMTGARGLVPMSKFEVFNKSNAA